MFLDDVCTASFRRVGSNPHVPDSELVRERQRPCRACRLIAERTGRDVATLYTGIGIDSDPSRTRI